MHLLLRAVLALVAICSATYALSRIPVELEAEPVISVASRVLGGSDFEAGVLDNFEPYLKRMAEKSGCDEMRGPIATIRAYRMQTATSARDNLRALDHARSAAHDLRRKLACAPKDGMAWFSLFMVESAVAGRASTQIPLLRMSYFVAPHEGWISQTRAQVGATLLPSLDGRTQGEVRAEYAYMLRDNLEEAVAVFARASPSLRGRLLPAFALLPLPTRTTIAARLRDEGLTVRIPGVDLP